MTESIVLGVGALIGAGLAPFAAGRFPKLAAFAGAVLKSAVILAGVLVALCMALRVGAFVILIGLIRALLP